MIQTESRSKSPTTPVRNPFPCIKVLGGSKRRYASVGDIIKVSIKEAAPRVRVKKGEVYSAGGGPHRQNIRRGDGSLSSSTAIPAVLLNNKLEPIGTASSAR